MSLTMAAMLCRASKDALAHLADDVDRAGDFEALRRMLARRIRAEAERVGEVEEMVRDAEGPRPWYDRAPVPAEAVSAIDDSEQLRRHAFPLDGPIIAAVAGPADDSFDISEGWGDFPVVPNIPTSGPFDPPDGPADDSDLPGIPDSFPHQFAPSAKAVP